MKGQRVVWPSRAKVEIEEFEFPSLGNNEILVATECSLISPGTERAFLLGLPNAQGRYPSYPGYSNIGVVIDSGRDVDGFNIGDRVVSSRGHTSHFVATPDSPSQGNRGGVIIGRRGLLQPMYHCDARGSESQD